MEFIVVPVIFVPKISIFSESAWERNQRHSTALVHYQLCIDKVFDYIHLHVKSIIVLKNIGIKGTKTNTVKIKIHQLL